MNRRTWTRDVRRDLEARLLLGVLVRTAQEAVRARDDHVVALERNRDHTTAFHRAHAKLATADAVRRAFRVRVRHVRH